MSTPNQTSPTTESRTGMRTRRMAAARLLGNTDARDALREVREALAMRTAGAARTVTVRV